MGHLSDSAFATLVKDETKSISAEEIARVKADWEEKQKKKKEEKEKNKEKEKEKDKDKDKEDSEKEKSKDKERKEESAPSNTSGIPSTPTHERYILHRDFFAS